MMIWHCLYCPVAIIEWACRHFDLLLMMFTNQGHQPRSSQNDCRFPCPISHVALPGCCKMECPSRAELLITEFGKAEHA